MFELDEISKLVSLPAEMSFAEAEKELQAEGYTLGFFHPGQSRTAVGTLLEQGTSNLYAPLYGEWNDLCVSVRLQTRAEGEIRTTPTPRQATGPNWKNLIIGSKGQLGTLKEVVLKIFKTPEKVGYTWIGLPSTEASFTLEKELVRQEIYPRAFGRFSKSALRKYPKFLSGEVFLILEWAGSAAMVTALIHAFDNLLDRRYSYRHVTHVKIQDFFFKLLRRKMPDLAWGNFAVEKSDMRAKEVEERLAQTLSC